MTQRPSITRLCTDHGNTVVPTTAKNSANFSHACGRSRHAPDCSSTNSAAKGVNGSSTERVSEARPYSTAASAVRLRVSVPAGNTAAKNPITSDKNTVSVHSRWVNPMNTGYRHHRAVDTDAPRLPTKPLSQV